MTESESKWHHDVGSNVRRKHKQKKIDTNVLKTVSPNKGNDEVDKHKTIEKRNKEKQM